MTSVNSRRLVSVNSSNAELWRAIDDRKYPLNGHDLAPVSLATAKPAAQAGAWIVAILLARDVAGREILRANCEVSELPDEADRWDSRQVLERFEL